MEAYYISCHLPARLYYKGLNPAVGRGLVGNKHSVVAVQTDTLSAECAEHPGIASQLRWDLPSQGDDILIKCSCILLELVLELVSYVHFPPAILPY